MKIKRNKGFSLAEILISLTVVSIVMAAAAPIFTKKSNIGDESWKWTSSNVQSLQNGAVYTGDTVIIGASKTPLINELYKEKKYSYSPSFPEDLVDMQEDRLDGIDSLSKKSKLTVVKNSSQRISGTTSYIHNFADSHIALYNIGGNSADVQYVGRLASDQYNLAFGIGTLQSLESEYIERAGFTGKNLKYILDKIEPADSSKPTSRGANNTAIGHYALSKLKGGNSNVAVGYRAMLDNKAGHGNVAVGYNALVKTAKNADDAVNLNTVVGNFLGYYNSDYKVKDSGTHMITGDKNVIIGNYTKQHSGNKNLVSNNVIIGNDAVNKLPLHKNLKFNSGDSTEDNKFKDVIAFDDIIQIVQNDKDSGSIKRKIVINGDFTIRSMDGTRTIFKVDGSGVTINVNNNHSRMTMYNGKEPYGPDRCEGAEICIGKFNVPVVSSDYIITTSKPVEKYDAFIKGMAVAYDGGSYFSINNVKRVPFLAAGLTYLDRFKDSNGAVINFLKWLNESGSVAGSLLPGGLSSIFDAIGMTSDGRLKNIYGDSKIGLKEINALKIKNYTYKADKNKTPHVGVIAQELQEVFPNSVHKGTDGYLSITQEEMFYGLVKSIQELSNRNNQIKEKIEMTKEQIKFTNEQNSLLIEENKLLEKQNKEFAKRIAKLQENK